MKARQSSSLRRRFGAIAMAVCLTASLVPVPAIAEETQTQVQAQAQELQVEGQAQEVEPLGQQAQGATGTVGVFNNTVVGGSQDPSDVGNITSEGPGLIVYTGIAGFLSDPTTSDVTTGSIEAEQVGVVNIVNGSGYESNITTDGIMVNASEIKLPADGLPVNVGDVDAGISSVNVNNGKTNVTVNGDVTYSYDGDTQAGNGVSVVSRHDVLFDNGNTSGSTVTIGGTVKATNAQEAVRVISLEQSQTTVTVNGIEANESNGGALIGTGDIKELLSK